MPADTRSSLYEVWSCDADGEPHMHGTAFGVTFEDACKQLASESVDFWTHYDKGRYRGRVLYGTREQAVAVNES